MNTVFFRRTSISFPNQTDHCMTNLLTAKKKQQFLDETAGFPARHIIL